MSLILEALKKSEQQRRLGEAPTFGTPAPLARRRRNLLPLLAVLIVAALGVGWWLRHAPPTPATNAALPATATAAAPAPPPVDATRSAPAAHPAQSPKPAGAKPVVARPSAPLSAATTSAPVLPMPTTDRPGSVAPLPAMPVASGPGAPHPEQAVASGPGAPHPAGPAIAGPTKPTTPPVNAPVTAAAKEPAPAPAATHPAAPAAKAPALLSVWDLPYSTRKDIPEMALTMHVYSDAASDRFVVIKGERHVEGDELADGVILREISPEGMVLEFKGQRFLYPREGR